LKFLNTREFAIIVQFGDVFAYKFISEYKNLSEGSLHQCLWSTEVGLTHQR